MGHGETLGGGGERLAGRYEIVGLLGAGGMGTVYRARDEELGVVVALKLLRGDLVHGSEMLQRFRREVALARRVTHPNVARVYDIGSHGEQRFLTMEFVDGESLAALVAREGALPLERVVDITTAVCRGLAAAHAAGVIHRDLKPDNVLLDTDGRVVITDFGVARALMEPTETAGNAAGTPAYMAPEQVEGSRDLDARVDVYALGAMLYELCTGARPWAGDSPFMVAAARLAYPPPDPRVKRHDLPDAIARIVLRCMARPRDERYERAEDVAAELAQVTLPAARTTTRDVRVRETESLPGKTVAVLPFRNLGAAEDDYVTDGLMDDLIDVLSMTPGIRVRPHGVVRTYKGVDRDPRDVGRELGVQVVVEGTLRRLSQQVRITARAITVADGFQIWAKRFDRPERDLLMINDEAARAIAEALTVEAQPHDRVVPCDTGAVELYLRARAEARTFAREHHARAVDLMKEACRLAPDDPTLLSRYAMTLARHLFFTGHGGELAVEIAERSVARAPALGEGYVALGIARWHVGDSTGAAKAARIALARAPGVAEAHALAGRVLLETGRIDEAARRFEAALELDPTLPNVALELSRAHAFCGRWDEVARLDGTIVAHEGKLGAWVQRARHALWRRDPVYASTLRKQVPADPGAMVVVRLMLALACGEQEPSEIAEAERARGASASSGVRLRIYTAQIATEIDAFLGRHELAMGDLETAVSSGLVDLLWIDRCPILERLRQDPRWGRLRQVVNDRTDRILEAFLAPSP